MSVESLDAKLGVAITEAEPRLREALGAQGFGILTEIDVSAVFEAKLGIKGEPMKILGACNPQIAHRALEIDPTVALLLPCNVVLRESAGETTISIADPRGLMSDPAFKPLADEAVERLTFALESLSL